MSTRKIGGQMDSSKIKSAFLIIYGPVHTETHEIGEFLSIGRDPTNRIRINDPFTSSRHALIERRENQFILKDQNSSNGTFLNGQSIIEVALKNNDRITIGQTKLYFSHTRGEVNNSTYLESKNTTWSDQLEKLPAMGQSDLPVLIQGPSGTGKEKLARLLHDFSDRSKYPFISVNCSALSENLVESELFGHVRGSFSGATGDRKGAFESARGGTLFLDEIGDLPPNLQPKLLRALENQEVKPVGSDKPNPIDVRIVAATHKNLAKEAKSNQFRPDLYFRLNVLQINPPALNQRMEDFEDLLAYFSKQSRVRLTHDTVMHLKKHTWPGNIRELKNLVSRLSALYGNREIVPGDVVELIDRFQQEVDPKKNPDHFLKTYEKEVILERLIANHGNQRQTARELGIPKSTLHDRIKSFGIDLEKVKMAKA